MMSDKDHNKRKDPFQAPEGYFDSLADRIESRIEENEHSKSNKGRVISMPVRAGWAAAAVISLLAIFWTVSKDETAPSSDQLIAALSDEEIIDYLVATDMSLDEIIESTHFAPAEADSLQMDVMPDFDLAPGEIDDLIELYDLDDLEELENS